MNIKGQTVGDMIKCNSCGKLEDKENMFVLSVSDNFEKRFPRMDFLRNDLCKDCLDGLYDFLKLDANFSRLFQPVQK